MKDDTGFVMADVSISDSNARRNNSDVIRNVFPTSDSNIRTVTE
jgi:hypothetical protein